MIKKYNKCLRCGRKLKSEESKERGFGNTCWDKYQNSIKYKELFTLDTAVNTVVGDGNVDDLSNTMCRE